ncbi:hypothetical protein [Cohnella lupini]|uniref:hypothetical protein n=1 Tax=Cohnella lupini TaxID=1294267 RepID=UPI00319E000A
MGWKRAGALLLLCTPLIDLVLLAVTVIDLRGGAEASVVHGIAAIYIAVSVVYGHSMIKWADVRFAHRFAEGPAPVNPKVYGKEHASRERQGWYKHLLAWAIGCVILYGMILMVNAESRTSGLSQLIRTWSLVLGIDFLVSFTYTFWPRRHKDTAA